MTSTQLILRSLSFHWRANVAVTLCVATGTAVLTGALLVGDSMRGSLRDITLDRLGKVDYALRADRFFRESLAEDLSSASGFVSYGIARAESPLLVSVEPAIALRGSISKVSETGTETARTNRARIWGVSPTFWGLARQRPRDSIFQGWGADGADQDAVLLGEELARELGVATGDTVLVRVPVPSEIPREAVLGRKDDTVRTMRLRVAGLLPAQHLGRFGLEANQRDPRNVFIPLAALQQSLRLTDRANTLLVSQPPNTVESPVETADRMQQVLAKQLRLEDLGLRLRPDPGRGYVALESLRMVLEPAVADAAIETAADLEISAHPVLAYLANSIDRAPVSASFRSADDQGYSLVEVIFSPLAFASIAANRALRVESRIPYSTVGALQNSSDGTFPNFRLLSGRPLRDHGEDEILLNEWAAADLGVRPGDHVRLRYFAADPSKPFETAESTFVVRGIVAIDGTADDPGIVPEYPGISNAKTYSDWDPPFPMDLKRVRPKDDEYWEQHRTTPKVFLSLETGERLWGSRFGKWTSIRLSPETAKAINLSELQKDFARELLAHLKPEQLGLRFQAVKEQGLAAAQGATDFSQLFLAFSFFLIVAAAILVGLVFRLSVERRAKQIGLLLATGFGRAGAARLFLVEGLVVACVGSLLGTSGGVGYAWLVMAGLRTWWLPAVGSSLISLHATATGLAIGCLAGNLIAAVAIASSLRGLVRLPPRELLAGSTALSLGRPRSCATWLRPVAMGAIAVCLLLIPVSLLMEVSPALFFSVGSIVLVASLALVADQLRGDDRTASGRGIPAILRLGARNAERHRGRSLLTTALIACATFVIVAVGANRQPTDATGNSHEAKATEFALVAECDVPLLHNLNLPEGRRELGIPDENSQQFASVRFFPFRVRPGDDASCLNLYQPVQPRILGASAAMIKRGGFRADRSLAKSSDDQQNPWRLLDADRGPDVIPALGDANSVRWILKLGLGDRLAVNAEDGRRVELEIVATLSQSIFQSELVISESNFRRLFPSQTGYSYFLIEDLAEGKARAEGGGRRAESQKRLDEPLTTHQSPITSLLEQHLGDFGFDATPVTTRLAEYHAVENTYLSTFQMLGGLGLMLGTLGLGAVLLRSVLERRGELALLLAVGYRPSELVWLVLAETGFLLVAGLAAGAIAALVAVAPHVIRQAGELPWSSLAGTLAIVLLCGAASSVVAVLATLRTPLLPALRSE